MFSKLFFVTAVAVAVNAQSSIAGLTPCILACFEPAATQNGCTFDDASCICASAQFQADVVQCLDAHCSAADVTAAAALQSSQCSAVGISPTGSVTGVNTVPFTLASSGSATVTPPSQETSTPPSPTTITTSGRKGGARNHLAIIVGCCGAAILVILLGVFCARRRMKRRNHAFADSAASRVVEPFNQNPVSVPVGPPQQVQHFAQQEQPEDATSIEPPPSYITEQYNS